MINPAMMPQIAALLAARQGQMPQLQGQSPQMQQPQQQPQGKPPAYYGSIPEIAKARGEDPRQMIANTAMAEGMSTAPVAQGGWAWADGIARALQGGVGGYVNKQNDKKYAQREQDMVGQLQQAAAMASTPQPPMAQAAQALGPANQGDLAPPSQMAAQQPPAPIEAFTPPASAAAGPSMVGIGGGGLPQGATPLSAPQRPPQQPPPQAASPMSASARSPAGSQAARGAGTADVSTLFRQGIVSQEGVQNRDGTWKKSFKGAVGPAQIMPATGPEAARLAGVPWDEKLFKANTPEAAEYNLKLGEAYYAKQLETFGDPLKAAAAYNAGPGAVQRAVRRANKNGGEWTSYLPVTRDNNGKVVDTTAKYVERFAQSIGSGGGGSSQGGSDTTRTMTGFRGPAGDIPVIGATQVPEPQYERELPNIGGADYVPPEVQTNRIAMAQQMLASGNPDMVAMARAYLDQGLTEQNQARMQQNTQQFTMGRDERGYDVQNRFNMDDRNFGRETDYNRNRFQAGESAAGRAQDVAITAAGQQFSRDERTQSQTWQSEEADKDRMAQSAIALAKASNNYEKDPLWTTDGGRKEVKERTDAINAANDNIDKIDRFLRLNEQMPTGGLRAFDTIAGIEGALGNAKLSEMSGLQKQITIDTLGGLGVAISDGDRRYVDQSFLSVGNSYEANKAVGALMKGIAQRSKEYQMEYLDWRAENGPRSIAQFTDLWDTYKNSHSVIVLDKAGKPVLNEDRPSFRQWLRNIPVEDGS